VKKNNTKNIISSFYIGIAFALLFTYLETIRTKEEFGPVVLLFTFIVFLGASTIVTYYIQKKVRNNKSLEKQTVRESFKDFTKPIHVVLVGGILGVCFQYFVMSNEGIDWSHYYIVIPKLLGWAFIGSIWAKMLYSRFFKKKQN
jgi:hypothetical protein